MNNRDGSIRLYHGMVEASETLCMYTITHFPGLPSNHNKWLHFHLNLLLNPYVAKLINLNINPLKVVSRYRDLQLQAG